MSLEYMPTCRPPREGDYVLCHVTARVWSVVEVRADDEIVDGTEYVPGWENEAEQQITLQFGEYLVLERPEPTEYFYLDHK